MSDWEQRLRLYSATASTSRQRSVSPSTSNTGILLDVPPVGSRGNTAEIESLSNQRAKSPNALERLRASTAMNLVALEMRGDQQRFPTRTGSPAPTSTVPQRNVQPPPLSPSGAGLQGWGPSYGGGGSGGVYRSTETVAADGIRRASSPSKYPAATYSSPREKTSFPSGSQSTYAPSAGLPGRHNSPLRSNTLTAYPTAASSNTATVSSPPGVGMDALNPQAILHVLESKIRSLESRNQHLESAFETLAHKNQELAQDLSEAEARIANQASLQGAVASLQHEVDRLREELLASAQREERRVEEVRRRASSEIEEARRVSASREQEINNLRGAIRQLANIERSVD